MSRPRLTQGLIQVYTGNSKGKSTASFGLTLRAVGHGFKVYIIQFMKGASYYGELFGVQRLYPDVKIRQYGRACAYAAQIRQGEQQCTGCGSCFIGKGEATQEDIEIARLGLKHAEEIITSDEYDIVILDEINNALFFDLLTIDEVLPVLNKKPPLVELILTGRNAFPEIIEKADLVTEMVQIKHPYEKGIPSRRGIEY